MKELQGRTKTKKDTEQAGQVLADDRFKAMFQDTEYAIDRNSESYKLLKPTQAVHRVESDEEAEPEETEAKVNKGKDFNSLFAGKEDEGDDQGSEDDGA